MIKKADDLLSHKVPLSGANDPSLQSILTRGADEIQLLSTMTRTFNNVNSNPTNGCAIDTNESGVTDHPSLSVLRGAWPCLSYLAQKYSCYDVGLHLSVISLSDIENVNGAHGYLFHSFPKDNQHSTWRILNKLFIVSTG